MLRVLVTGGTGLIGKEICPFLKKEYAEIFLPSSKEFNVFDYDQVEKYIEKIKPDYLIHLAWITGGDYLTNAVNEKYKSASMHLLEIFQKYGGKRVVFAGTFFEYDFDKTVLNENGKLRPETLYAKSKVELYKEALRFCKDKNIDFTWGRIFCVYGRNEKKDRLTPYIIDNLRNNKEVCIKHGQLVRDYMYSKEIARAFVEILFSDVCGAINICTGNGISLGDYALLIAKKLGKEQYLSVKNEPASQPIKLVGDNDKLTREVGYRYIYNLESAIDEILMDN